MEVTEDILKEIYKKRPADSKKYDFGLVVIIGGSKFYSGSPALSAMAAFRAGADMTRIMAPERPANIIAGFSPDLAAYPLEGDYLTKKHLAFLIETTEAAKAVSNGRTAVVIGGGIGRTKETQEVLREYLKNITVPAVIDADGIYAVAESTDIVRNKNFLLTPHSYEFFILTKEKISDFSEEGLVKIVAEKADLLGTTILLKHKVDILSDGKETALIRRGSPYMTVGGTGDTLAGIAGALLARGVDCFKAGCAAALINDLAGEFAAQKMGDSMTATDLIGEISSVLPKF